MKQPKILVTGATGRTGSAVVDQLLAKDVPVRALVHSKDARSAALERKGADTAVADMFDLDQLLAAMRGTRRAYHRPFYHPYMIQSATAFAVAAREAKLEAVVSLGQWLASPTHPSLTTRQRWFADQVFSMVPGVAHVRVSPGYFADSYLQVIDNAAHFGMFPTITGDGEDAPPSNERHCASRSGRAHGSRQTCGQSVSPNRAGAVFGERNGRDSEPGTDPESPAR
jgi:NAD(P)H dehydrogenase (quinone)